MSDSEAKVETKDERRGSKLMPETDIPPFKDNFMGAHGLHPDAYFSRYFFTYTEFLSVLKLKLAIFNHFFRFQQNSWHLQNLHSLIGLSQM